MRDQNYAVDDEGRYHMVKSDGWAPKNDALDLALEEDKDREERSHMALHTTTDFQGFELPLSHQPAAHCENGAISTLLRYYGIELSEPMIFGLASGLFFVHLPFIKMSGMPVTAFRTFPGVLFKRITKLLGIKTETRRSRRRKTLVSSSSTSAAAPPTLPFSRRKRYNTPPSSPLAATSSPRTFARAVPSSAIMPKKLR